MRSWPSSTKKAASVRRRPLLTWRRHSGSGTAGFSSSTSTPRPPLRLAGNRRRGRGLLTFYRVRQAHRPDRHHIHGERVGVPSSNWLVGAEKGLASEVGAETILRQQLERVPLNWITCCSIARRRWGSSRSMRWWPQARSWCR